ncbi:Tfp pilus assembly protein PilZ [Pontibacter aydingkolensis]|uniref:SBBP repeat-containing protein n=1 Tax=Pontibacter aydingkolensis TaxID=1911536 RepID=A0ABS7CUC6_9BACT|nr:SBBP repeat-containing protein [Pontibacter aydingkolensis]MBW7467459.1 SBBP repeat-containing protein [Pontibacter aydingkolensis]
MGTASFGNITLKSSSSDVFIAKFDASGNVLWAQKAGGDFHDNGRGIAVDASGNVYVTGAFYGIATFGHITLTNSSNSDVFIAKYDASGNALWAQRAGGNSNDYGYSLALDASGNAYVTGRFQGTASFGNTMLFSSGIYDVFIAKYDASGNVLWAQRAGGEDNDYGYGVVADISGNAIVTGSFGGIAVFGSTTLISKDNEDAFLVKFNANDDVDWALRAGQPAKDYGRGIAVDDVGNTYVTGYYQGYITFGNTTLKCKNDMDAFLVKYSPSGTVLWARNAGGTGKSYGFAAAHGVAVDDSGNAYIIGKFGGTATFETFTLTSNSLSDDIFIAKYDASGNALWAQKAGGAYNDSGSDIAVDASGNAYITGSQAINQSGNLDFFISKYNASGNVVWAQKVGGTSSDSGSGIAVDALGNAYLTGRFDGMVTIGNTSPLTSRGNGDVFIAKYDAAGNVLWAQKAGGTEADYGYGIAVDGSGNAYVTGSFKSTGFFGATSLSSNGGEDVFIAKYDAAGNVLWVQAVGERGNDYGRGIALNDFNNAFVTGAISGSVTFGSDKLRSDGVEMFVAKLHNQPNLTGLADRPLSKSLMVYPNPASSSLRVSLSASAGAVQELRLLDVKGMAVLSQFYPMASGEFNQALDLSKLQRGVYLLQVVTDQGVVTKRVVKQ